MTKLQESKLNPLKPATYGHHRFCVAPMIDGFN